MKADKLYYIVFSLFRTFYVEKPVPVLRKKKIRTCSVYAPNFKKNPSTFFFRTSFSENDPYLFRTRTQIPKSTRLRSVPVSVHGYGYGEMYGFRTRTPEYAVHPICYCNAYQDVLMMM